MGVSEEIHSVAVTGATSMIGSAIVRVCLNSGMDVVAFVRPASGRLGSLPSGRDGLTAIEADLHGLDNVDEAVVPEVDAFIHVGWTGSASGMRDDAALQARNIGEALAAVRLAHRLSAHVFVGAGSQAECGRVEGTLAAETAGTPVTGYGIAKLAAGQMTRLLCSQLGIRHEWSRILSIYGPGDASQTMVSSVIASALYGRNPRCTKGEQLWDYLYCDDCARALLAMAEHGRDGAIYPVGSGVERPLREFIEEICKACGTGVTPELGAIPYPDKQIMNLCADISSLTEDTGFVPTTSFAEGISATIDWYRNQS